MVIDFNSRDFQEETRAQFEHQIVRSLLSKFGLAKARRNLYELQDEGIGHTRLTLSAFNRFFRSFPYYLASDVITNLDKDCTLGSLFTKWAKTKLISQWERRREEFDDAKPFGLIFKWPRYDLNLILYDDTLDLDGASFVYTKDTYVYSIQPLRAVLSNLTWEPTELDE